MIWVPEKTADEIWEKKDRLTSPILVHLFDPATGLRAVYRDEYQTKRSTAHYYFTDGNGGCDCNKGDMLARTLGLPEDHELWDLPCSGDRIRVEKLIVEGTDEDILGSEW